MHESMAELGLCPKCGLPLPEGGEGLCLRCLLEAGLAETASERLGPPPDPEHRPALLPDFGPYRTIGVLGEGGMGIVYLADQDEPIRRRVALKVLKHGAAGDSLARFKSEIQVLALMDHPGIAKIYDAGTTANGQSFLAMEYVPGIPITKYCDRELLGCGERLSLFEQVCQAVHHAHQKGIIHRDLKPSNVLVMLQDGKPVPKIIDFGVAKALNQGLLERTMFTETGMLIGTPEYMSPEQADPAERDVDSSTDIYSLGVLLYELLVGALPFDPRALRKAGYAEIQRMIREDEPPKPSTRLSSMGNNAQEVARRRRSDLRGLLRLLRGDLESITMKALQKDRRRRYASASEFASDIARHMANEPVLARPPEMSYRLRKFVRRHRVLVGAGCSVALALLIGAAVSFMLYLRASREQERAEGESYSANLSAAELQLRLGEVGEAKPRLAATSSILRGWEWRHLMARMDESSATIYDPELLGPRNGRRSLEMRFSEDGLQLFHYDVIGLRSWDLTTKRLVTDLSGLGRVLTIGPYGKTVLVGPPLDVYADLPAEGVVLRLYDVRTRAVLAVLRGFPDNPGECAISEDGAFVAAARDYKDPYKVEAAPIMVWDTRTGGVIARLEGHPHYVRAVRFSPDGKLLASASLDKTVKLWNLTSPGKVLTLRHEAQVHAISFSRDGRFLASGAGDGLVRIWEPATGRLLRSWKDPSADYFEAIAFSPDAVLLATTAKPLLKVWNVETGELKYEFTGLPGFANAIAFHPTAPRLYTGSNEIIKEWELNRRSAVLQQAKATVIRIAVSANGKYIASGSSDGTVWLFDVATRNLIRSWPAHSDEVMSLVFSPDSLWIAAGSKNNVIKLWNVSDGRLVRTLIGHTERILSLAFSPDGRQLISGSADRSIRVWDLTSNRPPAVIATPDISEVTLSRDGRMILALRQLDKALLLWDAKSGAKLATISSDTTDMSPLQPRSALATSQDGTLAIGPADTGIAIAVWNIEKRKLERTVQVYRDHNILALSISPDGSRVAVGGERSGDISIWDLRRGKFLVSLSGHKQAVVSLAWTPDGATLVSGSRDGMVRVWDTRSDRNDAAELLWEKLSDRYLLVEEIVQALEADRTITPELRAQTVELARLRGNAVSNYLFIEALKTAQVPARSSEEYRKALRRETVAIQLAPWYARGWVTLALLQYRTGNYDQALLSSNKAMEIQKSQAPDAHTVRAMAYYRLLDLKQAERELELGRHAKRIFQAGDELNLLQEAQSLIAPRNPR